jgi:DNA-binding response OmpR family regulator
MTGDGAGRGRLAVVDDEERVAEAYEAMLATEYDVVRAHGGEAALEVVDESVDVVLLDRRMPDLNGDEVLERLRERPSDVRVVMVTAVDPGEDILDMPFDDYLYKPVDAETLRAAVDQQFEAIEYGDQVDEFLEKTAKLGVLEASGHADAEQARRLRSELNDVEERLGDMRDDFEDIAHTFRDIDRA